MQFAIVPVKQGAKVPSTSTVEDGYVAYRKKVGTAYLPLQIDGKHIEEHAIVYQLLVYPRVNGKLMYSGFLASEGGKCR